MAMTNNAADVHRAISAPVIAIDWKEEIRSLRASPSYQTADHTARTLAKHDAMRVVLVVMRAGGRMGEHHADSAISVHCLKGRFCLDVAGATHDLTPGDVLVVGDRLPHSVVAVDECAFLLTIAHGTSGETCLKSAL
jgi:quercetin dioxygenase-like cupin family protein